MIIQRLLPSEEKQNRFKRNHLMKERLTIANPLSNADVSLTLSSLDLR